jgi:hypothetical protein
MSIDVLVSMYLNFFFKFFIDEATVLSFLAGDFTAHVQLCKYWFSWRRA